MTIPDLPADVRVLNSSAEPYKVSCTVCLQNTF